jgi:hypothetical protein
VSVSTPGRLLCAQAKPPTRWGACWKGGGCSQKCGMVGESQPVLIMINPIIFPRTRTLQGVAQALELCRRRLATLTCSTEARTHKAGRQAGRTAAPVGYGRRAGEAAGGGGGGCRVRSRHPCASGSGLTVQDLEQLASMRAEAQARRGKVGVRAPRQLVVGPVRGITSSVFVAGQRYHARSIPGNKGHEGKRKRLGEEARRPCTRTSPQAPRVPPRTDLPATPPAGEPPPPPFHIMLHTIMSAPIHPPLLPAPGLNNTSGDDIACCCYCC